MTRPAMLDPEPTRSAGAVPAALPEDEPARLEALRSTSVLDTPPERLFDDIARLAALICGTPIALVSLVDEHRQWFKARVGLDATETPRDMAFCAHAIREPDELFEVRDTAEDTRFRSNPLVTGDPNIRFYAGMPLVLATGEAVGTVCAIDRTPRRLTSEQQEALRALARQAAQLLQWRRAAQREAAGLRDEIDRKRQQLRQATALATHGLALMAYVDRAHVYRYVNERHLEYLAISREAMEGRAVVDVLGKAAYREWGRPNLERAFAGQVVSHTQSFRFPARGQRIMRVTYLPVHDESRHVQAVVVRAEDIDEVEQARLALAEANQRLQQRNETQKRFIHMMSHDIREPVNTICNFAGLLEQQSGAGLDEASRRSLGFIQRGGQRMQTLLDDLLAYLRLEGLERGLLRVAPVDLSTLFEAVREDLTDAAARHGARLLDGDLPAVQGDASLLRALFQNLLANAMKFHAPGQPPQVDWGWRAADGMAEVWVRDRGIGIATDKIDRLFAPFSRLVGRSQFEGTGLGLAICRRIAELHGGRIGVTSQPGLGSTFSVWLPRPAPAPTTGSQSA
jgi:PAS domain S-box-containing protein